MRAYKDTLSALPASKQAALIDEWVTGCNGARNRKILKRHIIDGIGLEKIAEEFELSRQQVWTIVSENRRRICEKIRL